MTTVAYIANEFPSSLEPYVMDEIRELRGRGLGVICCSGKRVAPSGLDAEERPFWEETRFFHPLSDSELMKAARRLSSDRRTLARLLKPVLREPPVSPLPRLRALGHTLLGAALARELEPLGVGHIHAHHGYFASWMALVAARLLGIGFSFTLHGSDLLLRADLLAAKLYACRFCVTVSDFNRQHILRHYPSTGASKIIVQRLGVDRPCSAPDLHSEIAPRRFCLLSVGRLHPVKNYDFLIRACAVLRDEGLDLLCWIAGEGPERSALQHLIEELRLEGRVLLLGHVPRTNLPYYYEHSDLVVLTSRSEGIPVVLMEAMAHGRLVLAPAITGIPELIEHGRTGFLYKSDSLADFLNEVRWILAHAASLGTVRRAAAESIAVSYDRQQNLRQFTDQFLSRIA